MAIRDALTPKNETNGPPASLFKGRDQPRLSGNNKITDLKIDNNAFSSRFEASVNGRLAQLDYRIEQGTIFLRYVEVPVEEQGRGIASKLTQAALKFARDNGLTVVPHCPFIESYVRRHPEELKVR